MKSTVFIFHGTEGYPEENWFPWLKAELEKQDFEVIVPQFPSPPVVPAKIAEWLEVFDQYRDKIDENTIVIGHSLGGIFAMRILEQLDLPIKATFFVGTPVGVEPIANYDRDESFSGFNFDWPKIKSSSKNFVVYQSDDDPYVGIDNGKELAKQLGVEMTFIPDAGHFNAKAGYLKFEDLKRKLLEI